jgi:hypothetical protein
MSITHAPIVGAKVEVDPDYLADHDLGGESLVTAAQRAALDAAAPAAYVDPASPTFAADLVAALQAAGMMGADPS